MSSTTATIPEGILPASDIGKLITALNRLKIPYVLKKSKSHDTDDEITLGNGFFIQITEGDTQPYSLWLETEKNNFKFFDDYQLAMSAIQIYIKENEYLKKTKK